MSPVTAISKALEPLVGLPLSIARSAADMRVFHFGKVRPAANGKGIVGEYALHVQCSWRFVGKDGVITGSADRFAAPEDGAEVEIDDPRGGCLQDVRLSALLGGFDVVTRSHTNATAGLIVVAVHADQFGGAEISLSGNVALQLFPDGSADEDWRFFETDDSPHFVIKGGKLAD